MCTLGWMGIRVRSRDQTGREKGCITCRKELGGPRLTELVDSSRVLARKAEGRSGPTLRLV